MFENIAQQNAGEGPGLLRGLFESTWFRKDLNFLLELFGFKSLAPQLPVTRQGNFVLISNLLLYHEVHIYLSLFFLYFWQIIFFQILFLF